MSNFSTITNSKDYVNYVFNIGTRGVIETTTEVVGMSHTIQNLLGNLAFKTSEYLTSVETIAMGFGIAASAAFAHATQSAVEFQQATASVEAISGKNMVGSEIGAKAMALSNEFGLAVGEMTEGLEALARAGIVANDSIDALMRAGVQMSKFEGTDLEESINSILSTTNLLNPDVNPDSDEYAQIVADLNQRIISTSESAPLNAKNIMDTLQHVGGYASATGIDQADLFATIAQLGAKGTKGDIAGTSLRAFISAGQKDTGQRALARIGLDVSDLWTEDGSAMLPISEVKRILDEALVSSGFSPQERLEFYSDFAGYKQANQIMKIDSSEVDEYRDKIDNAMTLTDKMNIILGTVKGNWSQIWNTVSNFMTKVGSTLLPIINAILIPIKYIVKTIDAIPFSNYIGAIVLGSVAIKGISTAFNALIPTISSFVLKFTDFEKTGFTLKGYFDGIKKNLMESRDILQHINDKEYMKNILEKRDTASTDKELDRRLEREAIDQYYRQRYGKDINPDTGNEYWIWDRLSASEKAYIANAHAPEDDIIKELIESRKIHYENTYSRAMKEAEKRGTFDEPIHGWANQNAMFENRNISFQDLVASTLQEIRDNIGELIQGLSGGNIFDDDSEVSYNESNRERNRRQSDFDEVIYNESNRERNRRQSDAKKTRNRRTSPQSTFNEIIFIDKINDSSHIFDEPPANANTPGSATKIQSNKWHRFDANGQIDKIGGVGRIRSDFKTFIQNYPIRDSLDIWQVDSDSVNVVKRHINENNRWNFLSGAYNPNDSSIKFHIGEMLARYTLKKGLNIVDEHTGSLNEPREIPNIPHHFIGTVGHEITHAVLGHGDMREEDNSIRYSKSNFFNTNPYTRVYMGDKFKLEQREGQWWQVPNGTENDGYNSSRFLVEKEANYNEYLISKMLGTTSHGKGRIAELEDNRWNELIRQEHQGADMSLERANELVDAFDDNILDYIGIVDGIILKFGDDEGFRKAKEHTKLSYWKNYITDLFQHYGINENITEHMETEVKGQVEEYKELREEILQGEAYRQFIEDRPQDFVQQIIDLIDTTGMEKERLIKAIHTASDKATNSAPIERKAKALHSSDIAKEMRKLENISSIDSYKTLLSQTLPDRQHGFANALMAMAFAPYLDKGEMDTLMRDYEIKVQEYKDEEWRAMKQEMLDNDVIDANTSEVGAKNFAMNHMEDDYHTNGTIIEGLLTRDKRARENAGQWLTDEMNRRGGVTDKDFKGMKIESTSQRDAGWNIIKRNDTTWSLGGYEVNQKILKEIQNNIKGHASNDYEIKNKLATLTPDQWLGYYLGLKDFEKATMEVILEDVFKNLDLNLWETENSNFEYDFINNKDYAMIFKRFNIPKVQHQKDITLYAVETVISTLDEMIDLAESGATEEDLMDMGYALEEKVQNLKDGLRKEDFANENVYDEIDMSLRDIQSELPLGYTLGELRQAKRKIADDYEKRMVRANSFNFGDLNPLVILSEQMEMVQSNNLQELNEKNKKFSKQMSTAIKAEDEVNKMRRLLINGDEDKITKQKEKILKNFDAFRGNSSMMANLFRIGSKDNDGLFVPDYNSYEAQVTNAELEFAQLMVDAQNIRSQGLSPEETKNRINELFNNYQRKYDILTSGGTESKDALQMLKEFDEKVKTEVQLAQNLSDSEENDIRKVLLEDLSSSMFGYNPKFKNIKLNDFRFLKQWFEDPLISLQERENRINEVAEYMVGIRDNPLARTIDAQKWESGDIGREQRQEWLDELKKYTVTVDGVEKALIPKNFKAGKDIKVGQSGYQFYQNVREFIMSQFDLDESDITDEDVMRVDKALQDASEEFFGGFAEVSEIEYDAVSNIIKRMMLNLDRLGVNFDLAEELEKEINNHLFAKRIVQSAIHQSNVLGGHQAEAEQDRYETEQAHKRGIVAGGIYRGNISGGHQAEAQQREYDKHKQWEQQQIHIGAQRYAGMYGQNNIENRARNKQQQENLRQSQQDLMGMAQNAGEAQWVNGIREQGRDKWIDAEANRIFKHAMDEGYPISWEDAKAKASKNFDRKVGFGVGDRTGDGMNEVHRLNVANAFDGLETFDINPLHFAEMIGLQNGTFDVGYKAIAPWRDAVENMGNFMNAIGISDTIKDNGSSTFADLVTQIALNGGALEMDDEGNVDQFIEDTLAQAEDVRDWTTLWTITPELKERELEKLEGQFTTWKRDKLIDVFGTAERVERMSEEEIGKYWQNNWVDDIYEWQARTRENVGTGLNEKIGAFNEAHNMEEGTEYFKKYMDSLGTTLTNAGMRIGALRDGMAELSSIFPVLTPLVWGLTTAQSVLATVSSALAFVTMFLTQAEAETLKGRIKQLISGTLGKAMNAIVGFVSGLSLTTVAIVAGVVASILAVIYALKKSAESHDKYVQELTEKQNLLNKESQGAYISYEQNKRLIRRGARDDAQQSYRESMYNLSKTKLESANLKRQANILKLAEQNRDMLWGEFGTRARYQKMGWIESFIAGGPIGIIAKMLAGEFKSTADEYSGYTGNIRRIREESMGGDIFHRPTSAMREVSAYYDSHQLAFTALEQYKTELGELYDIESRYVRRTGDVESARSNQRFQKALLETTKKTDLTEEQILSYLNWLQIEKNVDTATQAMQATADKIVASAEQQAFAVEFGYDVDDVMGLNGIEAQQKAMVQAQADMIKMEAEDKLWWKAFWAEASAVFWAIMSPITTLVNFLQYIYLGVNYIAQILAHGWWSDEAKQAGNALDRKGQDLQSSMADSVGAGRAGRSARIYRNAFREMSNTDLAEIGENAISPYDRNDFGNGASSAGLGLAGAMNTSSKFRNRYNSTAVTSKRNTDEVFANRLREEQRVGIFNIFDLLKGWRNNSKSNWGSNIIGNIIGMFDPNKVGFEFAEAFGSIFGSEEERQNAESALKATKEAVDKAKAEEKGSVVIKNININTDDDPEKIKTALMNMIIELQEQIQPRTVSRTVGEQSNSNNADNTDNTPDTNTNPTGN